MISYSFYLVHNTLILLTERHILRSRLLKPLIAQLDGAALWLVFAGYFGFVVMVSGALAYLGYRYIESPFLRYKPKKKKARWMQPGTGSDLRSMPELIGLATCPRGRDEEIPTT